MRYLPRNWGWYVAIWILFGPYLLILAIDPVWVARVIGYGQLAILPIPILVWTLFQNKNFLLGKGHSLEGFKKAKVDFWSKVIIFCLLVGWFHWYSIAYLRGVVEIVINGPAETTAEVKNLHAGVGAISNHLTLDGDKRYLSASYFPREAFKIGSTYKFQYIPYTQEIIAAELIISSEK